MNAFECHSCRRSLERRASGLSAAEALLLEEHLAGCGECAEQAHWLSSLRELSEPRELELSAVQREVVFERALRQARTQSIAPARPAFALPMFAGLGVLASVLLVWFVAGRFVKAPGASDVSSQPVVATLTDGEQRVATSAQTLQLAHATVEVRAGSTVRWNARAADLELVSGSVQVDVDPRPEQPFSVSTQDFRAHVLGTRFEVAMREVLVSHGRVRVSALDGTELRVLGANERFVLDASQADAGTPAQSAQLAPKERPVRDESKLEPKVDGARDDKRDDKRDDERARAAGHLLDEARQHVASRQLELARKTLASALEQRLSMAERAEALTLRADCARLEGNRAGALRGYLRVAQAFSSLPAGENALFMAARLEIERGHSDEASRLLTRYAKTYPNGRFLHEVRARQRELGAQER
jgi:ferric-dicitrate binding protein FerR (iron transport regulator)